MRTENINKNIADARKLDFRNRQNSKLWRHFAPENWTFLETRESKDSESIENTGDGEGCSELQSLEDSQSLPPNCA